MTLQQRLTALERQTDKPDDSKLPAKPSDMTDEQYNAIVIGLGLRNITFTGRWRHYLEKYKEPVKQILDDLEQGIEPKGVIVQAKAIEFEDIIMMDRARYFDE